MNKLRLRAEDTEDITILSACLQDAITMMADIVYQHESRRFVMMLNRYVWEKCCMKKNQVTPDKGPFQVKSCCRIRTGLHFDDVIKISSQNISLTLKEHPLELLSIESHKIKNGAEEAMFQVDFIFSGQGIIRLECEMINARMQDISQPWPTRCHPEHHVTEALEDETFQ